MKRHRRYPTELPRLMRRFIRVGEFHINPERVCFIHATELAGRRYVRVTTSAGGPNEGGSLTFRPDTEGLFDLLSACLSEAERDKFAELIKSPVPEAKPD